MDVGSVLSNNTQTNGAGAERSVGGSGHATSQSGGVSVQTDVAIQAALRLVSRELARGLSEGQRVRTQLRYDDGAARIVAEIVDSKTGNVIDSFPPDLVLKMIARNREELGPLVDFQT